MSLGGREALTSEARCNKGWTRTSAIKMAPKSFHLNNVLETDGENSPIKAT